MLPLPETKPEVIAECREDTGGQFSRLSKEEQKFSSCSSELSLPHAGLIQNDGAALSLAAPGRGGCPGCTHASHTWIEWTTHCLPASAPVDSHNSC